MAKYTIHSYSLPVIQLLWISNLVRRVKLTKVVGIEPILHHDTSNCLKIILHYVPIKHAPYNNIETSLVNDPIEEGIDPKRNKDK